MAKKTTDELLDDLATKIGNGFDNTMNFADAALQDDATTKDIVKEGVELAYKNTALVLGFYRSTYNLLFRRNEPGDE